MSLGNFARNRIDWNVENTMIASTEVVSSIYKAGGLQLYNNDQAGNYLALLAILAIGNLPRPMFSAIKIPFQLGGGNVYSAPLRAGGPTISGIATGGMYMNPTLATPLMTFSGSGDRWVHLGGAPLFVINPGGYLSVYRENNNLFDFPNNCWMSVSMIWSYYDVARPVAARRAA